MFVNLKPVVASAATRGNAVIARLRPQLAQVTGLSRVPRIRCRTCARADAQSNSTYQYTLKSDNLADLRSWAEQAGRRDEAADASSTDVDTDQQDNGVETMVAGRPATARARLGITAQRRRQLRSTTRSASARWRRSTPSSTSITSSWNGRRDYTRGPERAVRRLRAGDADRAQRRPGGGHRVDGGDQRDHRQREPAGLGQPGADERLVGQRAQQQRDQHGAAGGDRALRRRRGADLGQPPGRRARDDDLVQPRRRRDPQRRPGRAIAQAEADIGMPTNVRGAFAGTALQRPAVAGAAADADRRRASSSSTSCSASSTRA